MGTMGLSVTLANSIIGVGILAMPFCFQQCGVLLATVLLLFMGLVSRLSCYYLLKSAIIARRRNFEFLAFHVFGPAGKLCVELGIIGFLMGTCIAYFVVVGDLGPQIISKMFNINQSDILRTSIMVIVSLVCVLPLGLLRNVDSLSNVSAATIGFYFCLVLKVIMEAASQLITGDWHDKVDLWKPAGLLQCLPILSMALFCQTQLFEVFESMPSLSLEKMNVVTKNAINICTCVYLTLGIFGYIAFCSQTISGNILMSLSPTWSSDVIKLGFVMSLAFSFPLIIFPCRASLYSFLYRKVHPSHHDNIINHSIPETTFRCITVAIIAITLFVSLLLPNVELVLGLVGSTIGVVICVVFPSACFIHLTFKNTNERVLAKFTLVLGLCILVLGTYANLQAAENQKEKYDTFTQEKIDKIVEDFFEAKKLEKTKVSDADGVIKKIRDQPHEIQNPNYERKEYKVQPPNPVPPDAKILEKTQVNVNNKQNDKEPAKPPVDLESVVDQLIEPENKIEKTQEKEALVPVETEHKDDDLVKAENSILKQEKKLQENIDMIKHQKLIETIKQHGEEQKEILKEQKEILSELKKTKDEINKNQKEVETKEAQKIAVESIQKIAHVAIQSLSGVTDKPGLVVNNKPLEEIANDAVLDIAKKAVETIEAMKVIQDKPKENVNKEDSQPKVPLDTNIVPKNEVNKREAEPQNIVAEPNNVAVPRQEVKQVIKDEIPNIDRIESQKVAAPDVEIKPNDIPQVNIPVNKVENLHSHAPDEPNSYKEGEDAQINKQINANLNQNVPIAVAMSSKVQKPPAIKEEAIPIIHNNAQNDETRRKKREVVDCTKTNSLEDKLHTSSVNKIDDVLSKVDLNEALARKLPLDVADFRIRSLKSILEKRR